MDSLTGINWVGAGLLLLVVYFVGSAVYNVWFSPLSKFPGPFFAKISAWPQFYHTCLGNRHIWIWQCHQIYGDSFRFKPNGVLFSTPNAYRSIYSTKAHTKKGKQYLTFPRNKDGVNTLSAVDKMVHARKRRVLNSAFSEKAIRSAEEFVKRHVDRWNEIIVEGNDGKEWTTAQNISELTDYLIFDIMGDLCFGKSFDIKEAGPNQFRVMPHTMAKFMSYMYPIGHSPILDFWIWAKPRGLDVLFDALAPQTIQDFFGFVESNVSKRKAEESKRKLSDGKNDQGRKDLFHYLFKAQDESGEAKYSDAELFAEANLLIVAGADTTATTLVGLWFYLVRYPKVYAKLVDEIVRTFKSTNDIHVGPDLSSCVYLQACINEALRMCPAAVLDKAREVLLGGTDIDGQHVPQGTHVGVGSWTMMHNEEHFGDSWVFRPERWIVDPSNGVTEEDVARARLAFNPFTIGVGNCVGQKFAMEELLLVSSKTLRRMDIRLVEDNYFGGGSKEEVWGARDKNQIRLRDCFVAVRDGPMVQFKERIL